MVEYLRFLPRPLLDDIINNNCIPIVGAGFSLNCELPRGKSMPNWDALGQAFANEMNDYPHINPLDTISAYAFEFTRSKLVEKLAEFLHVGNCQPGKAHKAFCSVPFDIVCTTNFGFLLEKTYENIGTSYRPVIEEEQLTIATNQFFKNEPNITLLKIHGDLNHPNRLVATEEDYDSFLSRYPLFATYISNLLITRTPLFLGYSLEDPDFRQIWQVIKDRLGNLSRPAYTIKVGTNPSETAKFQRRGVKVINIPGRSYNEVFKKIFEEIRDYWIENYPQKSTNVKEQALAELSLPIEARSSLCYFSVPNSLLPIYKSYIYPIAEDFGFLPISFDDALTIRENILARAASIVERAELVIVDVQDRSNLSEIKIAFEKGKRVLFVLPEGLSLPHNMLNLFKNNLYSYIHRPKDTFFVSDSFLLEIENWFKESLKDLQPILHNEPKRLFDKKEYNAAVISAITLLETTLRNIIENRYSDLIKTPYRISLSKLVDLAIEYEIYRFNNEVESLREWIRLRNQIVHSNANISAKKAEQIVFGVLNILQEIEEAAGGIGN